jgi:hypothetical protein
MDALDSMLCGLTFELRWARRCGALGLRRKMGRRPRAAGPVCHAVGTHLERVVRPHCAGAPAALWHKDRATEDVLLLRS